MPAHLKYDWPTAEQIYLNAPDHYPRLTIKDISSRFSIPYQTVRRYAAKHKWMQRRDRAWYVARNPSPPQQRIPYSYSRSIQRLLAQN